MANPDVKTKGVSPEVFTEDAMTEVVEVKDASAVVGFLREALELRQTNVKSAAHERKVDLALETALAYLASDEELKEFSNPDRADNVWNRENSLPNAAKSNGDQVNGLNGPMQGQPTDSRSNDPNQKNDKRN